MTVDLPVPEAPKEAEPPREPKPPPPKPGREKPPLSEPARPITVTPAPKPEPKEPPKPALVMPLLDASDPMVRDGVVSFTRHEQANAWLSPSDLVRRLVSFVDSLALGRVSRDPVAFMQPLAPFTAKQTGEDRYEMDPASYARYNLLADVATSIDARRAADFYRLLQPLLQEAYQELGYGKGESFNAAVFRALNRIQETPVLEGPIPLVRPKVRYEYADPTLESRSPLQKQLIRMGPRNLRLIQRKASELALELRRTLNE